MDELESYCHSIQGRRRGEPLGPSSVSECYRKSAYRYHGIPESEPGQVTDAADVGTLLHLGWSEMIRSLYPEEERSPDVVISIPGLPRPGMADDVDWKNLIVTDLKGAGGRAWQRLVDRGDVYSSYWKQTLLYTYGLSLMVEGEWTMRIVLLNRDSGERAEFTRPADPRAGKLLASMLEERHNRLYQSVMDGGTPEAFPREGRGPGTSFPCDWGTGTCPWLSHCWPAAEGDLTPQATTVVDDPREIEAWAGTYIEAREEEGKAKQAKAEAGQFLRGISGAFGKFKISNTGGKPKQDIDCEAAVALLEEHNLPVPMKWAATQKRLNVNRIRTK